MGVVLKTILVALIGAALVATGAFFCAKSYLHHAQSGGLDGPDAAPVIFEVRPGDSFRSALRRLEDQGLVQSARWVEVAARISGVERVVRVGEYSLRNAARPIEILETLSSGRSIEYSITVPEGANKFEIADLVEKRGIAKREEFLALASDRAFIRDLLGEDLSSLEGYLFPETYRVTRYTGARGLATMMVERFKQNFAKIKNVESLGLSPHEIVILASIIEKETGAPEERAVISSVFHNRMKLKMRLQTDPTVIYGIWVQQGQWDRNITKADLQTPSPYNTYTLQGLPYGPIANPGLRALEAAVAPAESDFLFFVSRNDGTHIFSRDYAGHKQAVQEFQLDRRAREGKSWRDLSRRQSTPSAVQQSGGGSARK